MSGSAVTGLGSPRLDRLAHYLVPGGMTGNKMAVPDNLNCVHIEKTVIWTPMIIFLTSISMLFTLACMSWSDDNTLIISNLFFSCSIHNN